MKKNPDPLRMCSVCREMKPKSALLRLAVFRDGTISYDPTGGRAGGRGMYLCRDGSCIEDVRKGKRSKRPVIPEDVLAQLRADAKVE